MSSSGTEIARLWQIRKRAEAPTLRQARLQEIKIFQLNPTVKAVAAQTYYECRESLPVAASSDCLNKDVHDSADSGLLK